MNDQGFMRLPLVKKERNKMNDRLKDMPIKQLKELKKYHQSLIEEIDKDIDRRTVKIYPNDLRLRKNG
jgi:hypothetical protein